MGVLELPIEVIIAEILPLLQWNDLLRMRRINHWTKSLVDGYIRDHGGIPNSIEIHIYSIGFKTFTSFIDLGFSASRFYLHNSRQREEMPLLWYPITKEFTKLYGNQVTHLRVQELYTNPSPTDIQFYEALPNLQWLEVGSVGKYDIPPEFSKRFKSQFNFLKMMGGPQVTLPSTFKNLESFQILKIWTPVYPVSCARMMRYNSVVLEHCPKLKSLSVGYYPAESSDTGFQKDLQKSLTRKYFLDLLHYLSQPRENVGLRSIDFKNLASNFDVDQLRKFSRLFLRLCAEFLFHGIRVKNLPAKLFSDYLHGFHAQDIISEVVESLVGLHRSVLSLELPHLKALKISTLGITSLRGATLPFQAEWPNLEKLTVEVHSTQVRTSLTRLPIVSAEQLLEMLLGVPRNNLKSLELAYNSRMMDTMSKNMATFPLPSLGNIISNCGNLTRLQVERWPGDDNIGFSKLWEGLVHLEEVWLIKCKLLGDQAFIGEDETKPSFLVPKKLRKFYLWDLDKMPGITDLAFQHVFCHLNITEFRLDAAKPLENISLQGITALLTGEFAKSVRHFPFHTWKLSNVSNEDFMKLGKKFCKI